MADYSKRIEVDASFLQGVDGRKNIPVSFLAQELNHIGYSNYYTSATFSFPEETFNDTLVSLALESEEAHAVNTPIDILLQTAVILCVDKQVQYNTGTTLISGSINNYVECKLPSIFALSSMDILIKYVAGKEFLGKINIPTNYIVLDPRLLYKNVLVNYMNYTGYNDFYAVPLPAWEEKVDNETVFTLSSGTNIGWDHLVEIFFAGWVSYNTYLEACCSLQNQVGILGDVLLTPGKKDGLKACCCASSLLQYGLNYDLICSLLDYDCFVSDIELTPGAKYGLLTNVYSSYEVLNSGLAAEINLFPIYFDDYSLNVGDYVSTSGSICLDAHYGFYELVASGTYLKINDLPINTELNVLEDGYRMCYNPSDNFSGLSGLTKFTAHAENIMGDILEEDFYLTFGYIVEFDNKDRIGLDYGFNNKVAVRIEAENFSSCPVIVSEGYWFVSEERKSRDLGASIICQGAVQKGSNDLSATIFPHSTAYFYDKEMKVVLTAKDFNGNEMEPFVLEFKIRNDE